jgi:hypothetical protein
LNLSDLLNVQDGPRRGSCVWTTGKLDGTELAIDQAAWVVAEAAMRERCKGAAANFDLWHDAATGGRTLSPDERSRVEPFIRTGFGLPGRELPPDHLQGYVAEFVWFLVTCERVPQGRTLEMLKGPEFHVTGPGGDGLAIYESGGGHIFRLWEIKKHHGTSHVSSTVSRAYKQLIRNATEYLAQLTALAEHQAEDVAALLSQLVDLWIDGDARAGAGVAVSTSNAKHPTRCFGNMASQFPRLARPGQLEGLVVGLDDLPRFADRVKVKVWSALST